MSDAKQPACPEGRPEGRSEMVVTVVANVELPLEVTPSSGAAEARFAQVEMTPARSSSLPTSIQSVIEEAIRDADDDVETALIEALRSTRI